MGLVETRDTEMILALEEEAEFSGVSSNGMRETHQQKSCTCRRDIVKPTVEKI
jgi:hypothetical protein